VRIKLKYIFCVIKFWKAKHIILLRCNLQLYKIGLIRLVDFES